MYSIAVQLTGSQEFTETVEDILEYVSRDLTHPEGGFYTAEVRKKIKQNDNDIEKKRIIEKILIEFFFYSHLLNCCLCS